MPDPSLPYCNLNPLLSSPFHILPLLFVQMLCKTSSSFVMIQGNSVSKVCSLFPLSFLLFP